MFLAPTMVNKLVKEAEKKMCSGEGIRTIIYGGGPMYLADIINAVKIIDTKIYLIFKSFFWFLVNKKGNCITAITFFDKMCNLNYFAKSQLSFM